VLTSNVFAILGLRAMYFLLAGMHERFPPALLRLAIVLVFIGAKMLLIRPLQRFRSSGRSSSRSPF